MKTIQLLIIPLILVASGCRARNHLPVPNNDAAAPLPPAVSVPAPQPADNETPDASQNAKSIVVSVAANKSTYRRGETVQFTITARNTSDKAQSLTFMSGQIFDIMVTPKNGDGKAANDSVWTWSADKMFVRAIRNQTLSPGETQTFDGTWENAGNELPRGTYVVHAHLASRPRIDAAPIEIRLNE